MRRMARLTLFLTLVCCIAAGLLAAYAVFSGEDISSFTDTLGQSPAESAQGLAEAAADAWNRLQTALEGASGDASQPEAPAAAGDPPLKPAEDEGDIAVYFAPCQKWSPWGGMDKALLGTLKSAEKSILAAFYDLQWEEAADVLVKKHEAGIRVALVSDSHYINRDAMQKCIKAGIGVVFDDREPFMHNKFCVIDGQCVWTGSTNVTENGLYKNNNNALRIHSPALAENYRNEFEEMFDRHKFGGGPRNTEFPRLVVDDVPLECYFAPEDKVRGEIIEEIEEAEKTIDFMAFSFTSEDIAKAMAKRIRDGVRVRGLFEARNASSKYSRDEYLAEQGAAVFMDANKHAMHHKVIILDTLTVITGSYNFSQSAEKRNDENVLIIHSPAIAQQYREEFEKLTGQ